MSSDTKIILAHDYSNESDYHKYFTNLNNYIKSMVKKDLIIFIDY